MTAAHRPTGTARTVEKTKLQPADEVQLQCPNPECGRPDRLQLLERVTVATDMLFFDVGTSWPETDPAPDTERVVPVGGRELVGLRCDACGYSRNAPGDPSLYGWLAKPT